MTGDVVITGANSAVGQAIVRAVSRGAHEGIRIVAAVRSERAEREVPQIPEGRGRIARILYDDPETLRAACREASAVIHLAGILVERPNARYEDANLGTTAQVLAAAVDSKLQKFVLISAFGADATSPNRYLNSKGAAEVRVAESGIPYTILRPPLVLGAGTEGSTALARAARSGLVPLLGGGKVVHQPLDVDDLAAAALRATRTDIARNRSLDLAGPERLSYRALVERVARRRVRVVPIPVAPLRLLLSLRQRFLGPGFSPDVLDVLVEDTSVEATRAAEEIGIQLTPLDATLAKDREPIA